MSKAEDKGAVHKIYKKSTYEKFIIENGKIKKELVINEIPSHNYSANQRTSEPANQRTSEPANQRTSEPANQRTSEPIEMRKRRKFEKNKNIP